MHLQLLFASLINLLAICTIAQARPVSEPFGNTFTRDLESATIEAEPTGEVTRDLYTLLSHFHLPAEQFKYRSPALSRRSAEPFGLPAPEGPPILVREPFGPPYSTESTISGRDPTVEDVESLFDSVVRRGIDLNTAVGKAMPALEKGGWEAFVEDIQMEMGQ